MKLTRSIPLALLVVTFFVSMASADKLPCRLAEITNDEGWKIPGLPKGKKRAFSAPTPHLQMEGVTVQAIRPDSRATKLTLVSCGEGWPNAVAVREQFVEVTKLIEYSRNRRIFGYRVNAALLGKGAPRSHLGSMEILYFYDPDGDGRFKIMRYAGDLSFRIVVPDWVKKVD